MNRGNHQGLPLRDERGQPSRIAPTLIKESMITDMNQLQTIIEQAFENRAELSPNTVSYEIKEAVAETLDLLDKGTLRCC
jgi:hypothetical protein